VADIVAGAALPPTICKCEDAAYCSVVAAGSYSVPGQVGGWVGGWAGGCVGGRVGGASWWPARPPDHHHDERRQHRTTGMLSCAFGVGRVLTAAPPSPAPHPLPAAPCPLPRFHFLQPLGAVHSIGGDLSPLPFQSLLNASEDEFNCFQGGLGQATDTYNVSRQGAGWPD
jgi:hypothetical protein